MNLFLTYCCDASYLPYAEKLFSSLEKNSNTKILFYTINFDYEIKFKNVIHKKINCIDVKNRYLNLAQEKLPLLIKSLVCLDALENFDCDFCFLDADVVAIKNCDLIFDHVKNLNYCPIVNKWFNDFLLYGEKGNPFGGETVNVANSLEAPYLKYLGVDINKRKEIYRLANCFIFNRKNLNFFQEWRNLCFDNEVLNLLNTIAPSPVPEETLLNTLLFKYDCDDSFMSLVNFAWSEQDNLFFDEYKKERSNGYFYKDNSFWLLPNDKQKKEIYFFHGKCQQFSYDYIIDNF
jgi:hypothetical protein